MLTRTARRVSGSQHVEVSSTASMPSAAAERKIAPMFVASTTFSKTAMRPRTVQNVRRRLWCGATHRAQNTPRERIAGETGEDIPICRIDRNVWKAGEKGRSIASYVALLHEKRDGGQPASSAVWITFGLSAMKTPFSGSSRFRSCACVSLA